MLSRLDGAPVRPPVSRYAAPAWSLFADLLPLRGDRSAFGHSMRPLNVSECHFYHGAKYLFDASKLIEPDDGTATQPFTG